MKRTEAREPAISLTEPLELRHPQGEVFLTLQQKQHYLEAKWHGHITADEIVTAAQVFLEVIETAPCTKLLNDKSEITGDWQEANDWLEFEWFPKVIAAGLRCYAHVYSTNMFSRLSARDLYMRVLSPLQMFTFDDRKSAEAWLMECR